MLWQEVRAKYPSQWLLVEACRAHSEAHRRVLDALAVIEPCPDGAAALRRYRELSREHPDREIYFVHTGNTELDVEERPWTGIRRNDAPHAPR